MDFEIVEAIPQGRHNSTKYSSLLDDFLAADQDYARVIFVAGERTKNTPVTMRRLVDRRYGGKVAVHVRSGEVYLERVSPEE